MRPRHAKSFVSPFFTLVKVLAVVDLCGHIAWTIDFKVPLTPMFAPHFENIGPTYLWSFPLFITYYLEFVHTMLVMMTALNRSTALVFPVTHESLWKKMLKPSIGVSLLLPLCLCFQRLLAPTYTMPFTMGSSNAFVLRSKNPSWYPSGMNALFFALFYIVIGVITVMLNISSCMALTLFKQSKRNNRNNLWQSIQRTEIGLIIVCFGDLVAMIFMIIIQLTLYWLGIRGLYDDPLYDFMYLQIPWVSDLGRFIRPFMLLFMSKTVRDAFLSIFSSAISPDASVHMTGTAVRNNYMSKVSIISSPFINDNKK
uniref:Serpentine receptor class gamma n=1 Tax=Panagrellus redivivus TaxID=6233 RepID=A0A7E4WE08_PANRE